MGTVPLGGGVLHPEVLSSESPMVVVGLAVIEKFLGRHEECRQEVSELIRDLQRVALRTPEEVRQRYPAAKILDGRLVVFKVRGNHFRLSSIFAYNTGRVVIVALETHAEYDRRTLR